MRSTTIALLLALLAIAFASDRVRQESRPYFVPAGWTQTGPADPAHPVKLIFAVKQRNLDRLEALFWDVSNPDSPNFGKFLSLDELTAMTSPSTETLETIHTFFTEHDVEYELTLSKDFATVIVPVTVAETLMETTFFEFAHTDGRVHVSSLENYSLPKDVMDAVDYVAGIRGFPDSSPKYFVDKEASLAAYPITPQVLRTQYKVNATNFGAHPKATQSVAEFQGQYYSPSDLKQFYSKYWPMNPNNYVQKVLGENGPSPGVEAELDIQFIKGVAPSATTWFWSNSPFDFWSDLTAWISQMNNQPENPLVHSISYGAQGALQKPDSSYQNRFNSEMQKLGVRGITIIFASGDSGTGCEECIWFSPSFPATSPYVTSVGATRFLNNAPGEEAAVESFGSGGGFSWDFKIPSYQSAEVEGYFKSGVVLPQSHFYTTTGRGTPDVSALGIGFQVIVDGETDSIGGTSASAPTFAGIVTLLISERAKNGKNPALGFLNQWLYQIQRTTQNAFTDVTVGENNSGCCGWTGFNCYKGWDPVTGLGTPNYEVLVKEAMKLP